MKKDKNQNTSRRPVERNQAKSPVFSYYSNRPASKASVSKIKKQVFRWQLIPSFIAGAVILGSLIYASGLNTDPRVSLDKAGPKPLLKDESVYTAAARDLLDDSIMNRSKLTINTKAIESKLLAKFPELETVVVTVPLVSRRPIVSVRAVQPSLLLVTDNGQYLIDNNGRTVLKAESPDLATKLSLPVIQDQTGISPELGKVTLTSREAAFISELYHQLQAKSVNIESLSLPPQVNALYLKVKDKPFLIKFSLTGDPRLQMGAWQAAQDRLAKDRVTPSEYIDVRVEEKVFFK
jgi:hypothetical protein